jgi:ataxia telangiectasia mutated family protein
METLLRFELLEYSEITETIRSMLSSVDLNGPSVLCDSSLMLWTRILKMRLHTASGLGLEAAKQISNWLRGVWTIGMISPGLLIQGLLAKQSSGTISDKIQAAQIALFARPGNILDLLLTCTNRSTSPCNVRFRGPAGPISKAWFRHNQNRALTEYLFSFDDHSVLKDIWHAEETFLSLESPSRSDPNDGIVTELLQAKTDSFSQAWKALRQEKLHHVTGDIMQIFASSCVVTAIFIECLPQPHGPRARELRKSSRRLWQEICEYVSNREDVTIQACLDILSPIISSAPCLKEPDHPLSRALDDLASPLIRTLEERRHPAESHPLSLELEDMDLDDPLFIRNETSSQNSIIGLNRESIPVISDATAFERSLTMQLSIFHLGGAHGSENVDPAKSSLASYLTTFDETDILCAQNLLPKIFSDFSELTRTDVLNILECVAEICLQSYQLERCEAAQCLCIYLMTCFVDLWTTEESDDLHDAASDLYVWFIEVLLGKKRASPRVSIALTELLARVINSNPAYSMGEEGPSSRTSLFNILQEGDMSVKFNVGKLISDIFGRFLLRDHDAIFDDVLESLPTDPDWNEGIALRLYVLAQLASRWHTLLRRSIYHIFETPGRVPESTRYARKCLRDVSSALRLGDAKKIFRLFSPQILYTWTETQSIKSMPFTIFGYPSLKEMLIDAQDELIGQIMMRANDQDAVELSKCLGSSFAGLLAQSFHKAEAYTIARDISIPPSQDSQPRGVESRIKKQLGTEQFVTLVEMKFPETVATLFRSLGQEEQIERAFAKRSSFRFASDALRRITEKSASTAPLPANQQPSFRARYFLDELEFLCKRAGYDLETMWTPALVSFVCRTLLESIHHALGSLYACSILRKIRILVCLAGPVIVQDYPLEQILHALRPFLTDFHCSEDALGLFWYLLEAGKPYLMEHPQFVTGIAVSTLVSLRDFLTSSRESTTQESQFRTVLSKSQEFREWFGDFLESYRPSNLSDDEEQSLRRMIRSSQKCSAAGNAKRGTHESELLLELLQDRASGRNLLKDSVSDLVLSLLCSDFQMPPDIRNDVLGEDKDAAQSTVAVWQTIQNGISEKEYRLWAARVIGRAYAATGQISDELLREQDTELFKVHTQVQNIDPFLASKITILDILCGILSDSNSSYLGLVEWTLQLIVSKIASYPELEQCEHAIPSSLMKALVWAPYHCPNIPLAPSELGDSVSRQNWDSKVPASQWARDLALSLAFAAEDDPVIGPLRKVLYTVPDLATRLLPYILHDVLLSEIEGDQTSRRKVSETFGQVLRNGEDVSIPHTQIVIDTILYLRNQRKPHESTIAERDDWLNIDYGEAASAASRCRMHKTALLFVEIQASRTASASRRASMVNYSPPPGLLHNIFCSIGDPDLFYGIQQEATLESVMEKLDYESAGYKNLVFQSAQYDSDVRLKGSGSTYGIIKALNATNLQGVASAVLSAPSNSEGRTASLDSLLSTAMSLQHWDIPVPPSHPSPTGVLFRAFQNMNTSGDKNEVLMFNNGCFLEILDHLSEKNRSVTSLRDSMRALGLLTEVDDVLRSTTSEQMEEMWERMTSRKAWLQGERYV